MNKNATALSRAEFVLSAVRYRISVPLPRWPLRWHVLCSATTIVVVATIFYGLWQSDRSRLDALHAQVQRAQADLSTMKREAAQPAATIALGEPDAVDRVIAEANRLAIAHSIKITSIQIDAPTGKPKAALRWLLVARSGGEYAATKDWISELTGRFPYVALSSIVMRPTAAGPAQLDVSVTFEVFQKMPP